MRRGATMRDPQRFIRQNLRLTPVEGVPGIQLYVAHEGSRLSLFLSEGESAPYWAFPWAGGLALAMHFARLPGAVRGLRVVDIGSGSGLVAIAAMKAGAASVVAMDADPLARAAVAVNAAANDVTVKVTDDSVAAIGTAEVVVAGDVFYDRALAEGMLALLDTARRNGATVLVGDPGRAYLPTERLSPLASYLVRDVGDEPNAPRRATSSVFTLKPVNAQIPPPAAVA